MATPLGALLLALVTAGGCAGSGRPNVLLVSIDTLRADRLGCYGYERDTSPALDRLAATRAVRFAHAVAESPWTIPSHVTLLSGLHPLSHGVLTPELQPGPDVPLLAEVLGAAGYSTFALTDGGWMSADWGFDRGFASFQARDQDFAQTAGQALEIIRQLGEEGPWFGFLHTYDVHCPYDPPAPWAERFQSAGSEPIDVEGRCGNPDYNGMELSSGQVATLSDRYDGGVGWVDEALGGLLEGLEALGVLENTILVVTSDHGEELGEHGRIGHEETVHAAVLEVPLLLAAPGLEPGTVSDPVGLADVVPTLLELCEVEAPPGLDGLSLVPLLEGESAPASAGRLSALHWKADLTSWLAPGEHLILSDGGAARLYDPRIDPAEQRDLAGERAARVDALSERVEILRTALLRGRREVAAAAGVAPETLERLRELGY